MVGTRHCVWTPSSASGSGSKTQVKIIRHHWSTYHGWWVRLYVLGLTMTVLKCLWPVSMSIIKSDQRDQNSLKLRTCGFQSAGWHFTTVNQVIKQHLFPWLNSLDPIHIGFVDVLRSSSARMLCLGPHIKWLSLQSQAFASSTLWSLTVCKKKIEGRRGGRSLSPVWCDIMICRHKGGSALWRTQGLETEKVKRQCQYTLFVGRLNTEITKDYGYQAPPPICLPSRPYMWWDLPALPSPYLNAASNQTLESWGRPGDEAKVTLCNI